jgi:rRNA maturation protein Nop10
MTLRAVRIICGSTHSPMHPFRFSII